MTFGGDAIFFTVALYGPFGFESAHGGVNTMVIILDSSQELMFEGSLV